MPSLTLYNPSEQEQLEQDEVGPNSTLRQCYEALILPELECSPATLELNQDALTMWERYTANPPVQAINRETLKEFRDKLLATPYPRGKTTRTRSAATVNRHMRHIRTMISPLWPADRHNLDGRGFLDFFKPPKRVKTKKRLAITFKPEELSALYRNCEAAKPAGGYRRSHLHNPTLWRLALVLALNTGPRTWDLFALKWSDIIETDFRHGSVCYESLKTAKLQRVPLNPVSRVHLDHVRRLQLHAERVFPGFSKCHSFYEAWNRIRTAAGIRPLPFETMRKTCSTLHNDIVPKAGAFLTGHELQGVNAEAYDNPTNRVLKAVYKLPQPEAFVIGSQGLST
ncbi:MAG: integrase [Planctomycetaceae bacterium]